MRSEVFSKFLNHHGFVIGPVADVHFGLGVVFEDDEVGADAVEEPAVVADDEGGACKFADGFFEGAEEWPQLGFNVAVLEPGQPLAMYHWEDDQEDFLVLSGEALLIVESEERPLRAWDLVHCPARTDHILVGAGNGPCVVVSTGSRTAEGDAWGAYTVSEAALRHGAGVEAETNDPAQAYAPFPDRRFTRYEEGWLP